MSGPENGGSPSATGEEKMNNAILKLLTVLLLLVALPSHAVYKCIDEKGKVEYGDKPCPDKTDQSEPVKTNPGSLPEACNNPRTWNVRECRPSSSTEAINNSNQAKEIYKKINCEKEKAANPNLKNKYCPEPGPFMGGSR